jgi:hypothetical protein
MDYVYLDYLNNVNTVFLIIWKRDGDRRIYERLPKMLKDDDYDKKSYWRSY